MEVTCESFQISHFLNASVPAYILDVVEWIRTHYDRPLSVAYIAEQFGYHPTYLTNVFKKYTGYPILTYINRIRIAVSKNLLANRTLSIYEIANTCGFSDEKYFMKLFKRYEGITPTQYRKAFQKKNARANRSSASWSFAPIISQEECMASRPTPRSAVFMGRWEEMIEPIVPPPLVLECFTKR